MRKYLRFIILISVMATVFCGCNKSNKNTAENNTVAPETTTAESETTIDEDNVDTLTRTAKVYSVEGSAFIIRDGDFIDIFESNTEIETGDKVCLESGKMTIMLDEDKYIYVEPGTEFEINYSGTKEDSTTVVTLFKGAVTNEIQNKLSENSSYVLNTLNSTMSVRGTIYRAEIAEDENGDSKTKISVFEGEVQAQKVNDIGETEEVVSITLNKELILDKEPIKEVRPIVYSELSKESLTTIKDMIESGKELEVDEEEIDKNLETETEEPEEPDTDAKEFTVTFKDGSTVFGTQIVKDGQCATVPTLKPMSPGEWDWDFSKKITEDVTIKWKYN